MAKTILEDVSAFLAQQNSWLAVLPDKIKDVGSVLDDRINITETQLLKRNFDLDSNIYTVSNRLDIVDNKLSSYMQSNDKTIDEVKTFITAHKAHYLVEVKKLYTRINKEHNWIVNELTGAATDRVDIRQELGYEITKRRSQDNALNIKIESEIADRIDKANKMQAALNASIAVTNLNVSAIDAKINTEIADRTTSITTLAQAVANEAVARNIDVTNINSSISTLNNSMNIEIATRVADSSQLQATINNTKSNILNTVSEIETRRISDLSLLSARDNLEEDQSKMRDYLLIQEIRNILAKPVNTTIDPNTSTPVPNYSNGINDWDQIPTIAGTADTVGTNILAGSTLHGLLANFIRKYNLLAKKIQGSSSDIYSTDTWSTSNTQIGLDYWQASNFRTFNNTLKYFDGTTEQEVLTHVAGTPTLKIGNGYTDVNIQNGALDINITSSTITSNVTTATLSNCTSFAINTSTGHMKAYMFDGIATSALYADLAERYAADDIYEEGTILAIGGSQEVTLFEPGMPLAGVVSKKPAFRMNDNLGTLSPEELETTGKMYDLYNPFIALKGRIPVKVAAPVAKGEYLLASNGGKAVGYQRWNLPNNYQFSFIGIALSDSVDGIVELKV